MVSAQDALHRLREGNSRFVADIADKSRNRGNPRQEELVKVQEPFAIILGCSDARVPAEIVFNQGIGDLFVIRVAGNIVAPSQVGSVEFAASRFGTRLVVVLSHSDCGAVLATVEELERPPVSRSPNLRAIVDRIRPAVEALFDAEPPLNRESRAREAIRANCRASVDHLRHGSKILESLIANDGLCIVGAEYSLTTGKVEFFDVPAE